MGSNYAQNLDFSFIPFKNYLLTSIEYFKTKIKSIKIHRILKLHDIPSNHFVLTYNTLVIKYVNIYY